MHLLLIKIKGDADNNEFLSYSVGRVLTAQRQFLQLEFLRRRLLSSHPRATFWVIFLIWT